MPKSYRFRTEVGVDKEVRLNIDQDFDFLEVLSLKFRQEDLYDRFCADYGVVAGRVVVNGGFGVPNVNISIFVPLDNEDANDPIISTLYPYKKIIDKNEDEDTIFKAKLAIMELDAVKKSKATKLKQEIRKAKTLIEVVSYLQKVMK